MCPIRIEYETYWCEGLRDFVWHPLWVEVEYWVSSTTQIQHQKDKERVVVCLRGTGQELHWKGYYTKGIDAAKEQRFLWLAEAKKDD